MKYLASLFTILLMTPLQGTWAAQEGQKSAPERSPECKKIMDDCLASWQSAINSKREQDLRACAEKACVDAERKCSNKVQPGQKESDAEFILAHKAECKKQLKKAGVTVK
jgi:hypothetical protein